jgi:hypothetical protein
MSDNPYRTWQKAKRSSDGNGCVEVSFDKVGAVAFRDSKLGDDSPVLEFSLHEFECFADGIANGEFKIPS